MNNNIEINQQAVSKSVWGIRYTIMYDLILCASSAKRYIC